MKADSTFSHYSRKKINVNDMSTLPPNIPIRICSPLKTDVKHGYLNELYSNHMLQAFFKAFKTHGYPVLSRKHGICFSWQQYDNYNDSEEHPDSMLIALLKSQAMLPEYNKYRYCYWNHQPLTNEKWIKMLRDAGFAVVGFRTLADIKAALKIWEEPGHDSKLF